MGRSLRALAVILGIVAARESAAQSRIPLCAGLTIANAVTEPQGDYEPLVTVERVDTAGVHLRYSSEAPRPGGGVRKLDVRRIVRLADLDTATLKVPWFSERGPVTIPGSTAIGVSRAVLRSLKATGVARLGLVDRRSSVYPARRDAQPNLYEFEMPYTLRRVADAPRELPVIVNGAVVMLPVIQARGEYMGDRVELVALDDEANPLALRLQLGDGGESSALTRVVKISHHCTSTTAAAVSSALERALLDHRRADIYEIYFDFNSDRIREQSEPMLREIAEVLRRHPDWRLGIEGHTDGIGSDRFNLELSARRAAAVKAALTERHGIAAGRLTTSGAGRSRPKDRNDTPEGRARNRRVELVRLP